MTNLAAVAALLVIIFVPLRGTAEEFKAMPGLWKTTLHAQGQNKSTRSYVQWQCVIEDENPFIAFARLPIVAHDTCERKSFVRRSTSLQWQLDCTGDFTLTNEGSLNFETAKHYTGTVKLTGMVMGYPIDEVLSVEGSRVAACTSPSD
jgi:uncharacterized protein DUF3617